MKAMKTGFHGRNACKIHLKDGSDEKLKQARIRVREPLPEKVQRFFPVRARKFAKRLPFRERLWYNTYCVTMSV